MMCADLVLCVGQVAVVTHGCFLLHCHNNHPAATMIRSTVSLLFTWCNSVHAAAGWHCHNSGHEQATDKAGQSGVGSSQVYVGLLPIPCT